MNQSWKPAGFRTITPYLVVTDAAGVIDFYRRVFGAEEKSRYHAENASAIMHAELRIGDSTLELADGNENHPAKPMELHLYVPDAAIVHERAVAAGAAIKQDLTSQDYGDQETSIDDPSGNHWYVATHQS
ncbi:MAG: VOC family protein, partial [Acidobacteria bacterium]|nr:VOC family protein [Acidobacteriota bacterium]